MELNLAEIHEALAAALADRPCLVWRDRTWTWREVTDRTRRLADVLRAHGLGRHGTLADLPGWASPHDHVGLYLQNGNAYLEAHLGASKAGPAAFTGNASPSAWGKAFSSAGASARPPCAGRSPPSKVFTKPAGTSPWKK